MSNLKIKLINKNLCFKSDETVTLSFLCGGQPYPQTLVLRNDSGSLGVYPFVSAGNICTVNLGCLGRGLYFFDVSSNDMLSGSETIYSEQLTVYEREYATPDFLEHGIIYHVFVDRFCKGNRSTAYRGDVTVADDFASFQPEYPVEQGGFIANNDFCGGNLWGVVEKLDYIASLGACAIYLSPVFEAYTNHKYDTGDYMKADDGFGGDGALRKLIDEAGKLGIAVIIDGVFNHTGSDSRYFNKKGGYASVGAYQSKKSPYYDWYRFKNYPDDYDCWWGVKTLPKIKSGCTEFEDFIAGDKGVLDRWLSWGIKGVRLDVVDELSNSFVEKIARKVKQYGAYLLGEVWEDGSNKIAYAQRKEYFLGRQLDGVMNYPLRDAIIDYLVWKNSVRLKKVFAQLMLHYPPDCYKYSTGFLGTHDTERILTVLGGEYAGEHTNAELDVMRMTGEQLEYGGRMVMAAYLLLVMLCGTPCLFYGDEVGMEGYRDPFNRRPYPWGRENASMLEWFRAIGMLKKRGELDGECEILPSDEKTLCCRRGKYTAFTNMSDGERTFSIKNIRTDAITGASYSDEMTIKSNGFILLKEE